MVKYEVYIMDEFVGTLLTDGPRRDRLIPNEAIKKYRSMLLSPSWMEDTGWTYIPLFENMIRDTMRQNPNAKYIARFTNEFVLVRMEDE